MSTVRSDKPEASPAQAVAALAMETKSLPGDTPQALDDFIPMSVPMPKLEVPTIPGYHLHWIRGTPERIAAALRARYEYVEPGEVRLNQTGVANRGDQDGSTDLGNRISVVAGGDANGQAIRLYLMKCKEEYWKKNQDYLFNRSEQTARMFREGMLGAEKMQEGDKGMVYVGKSRGKIPDMFKPKRRP